MGTRSTTKKSSKYYVGDSLFVCSCGSTEFRVVEDPLHLLCRCGLVYTAKDLEVTGDE